MKRFILGLSIALLMSTWVYSQQPEAIPPTEPTNEEVIENTQVTPAPEAEESMKWYSEEIKTEKRSSRNKSWRAGLMESNMEYLVAIVAIVFTFIFPVAIVFTIYYFRYKNRKQQYHLAEQALANGQPIPRGLFKTDLENNLRSKGINSICMGLGLFIFLWATTKDFGVGAIGLLLVFVGFGQVITYYASRKEKREYIRDEHYYKEESSRTPLNKESTNDTSSTEE